MFRIRLPLKEYRDAVKRNRKAVEDGVTDMLEVLGLELLGLIQLDYEVKSRGGAGASGEAWKQLDPKTIKRKQRRGRRNRRRRQTRSGRQRPAADAVAIGIDTGQQRNSAVPGFQGNDGQGGNVFELRSADITVGFGRVYSTYFDEERELIPDPLPEEWKERLDETAEEFMEEIVQF